MIVSNVSFLVIVAVTLKLLSFNVKEKSLTVNGVLLCWNVQLGH